MRFRFKRRQMQTSAHAPVWFPCPDCGRPVDAMDTAALNAHGDMHAAELLRSIGFKVDT